jgi:hypothetical protein
MGQIAPRRRTAAASLERGVQDSGAHPVVGGAKKQAAFHASFSDADRAEGRSQLVRRNHGGSASASPWTMPGPARLELFDVTSKSLGLSEDVGDHLR